MTVKEYRDCQPTYPNSKEGVIAFLNYDVVHLSIDNFIEIYEFEPYAWIAEVVINAFGGSYITRIQVELKGDNSPYDSNDFRIKNICTNNFYLV